jgi:hypothetical protein
VALAERGVAAAAGNRSRGRGNAGGTIVEANLDGTGATTLVSGQGGPDGLAVTSSNIYWANTSGGTIMAAGLAGTSATPLVTGQNPRGGWRSMAATSTGSTKVPARCVCN